MVMTAGQNTNGTEDAAGNHSHNPLSAVVARHGTYDKYSIKCVDLWTSGPLRNDPQPDSASMATNAQ